MQMKLREIAVPKDSLLHRYKNLDGAYTDCFEMVVPVSATLEGFVVAFYTTWLFRMERFVLTLAQRRWITDAQVDALAAGSADTFAVWRVEARAEGELLLSDTGGHTRSYLAFVANEGGKARLVFGSAVVPPKGAPMSALVRATVPLHKFYSRSLLRLAARRLRRG
jgi:hypothetical protein